MQGVVISFQVHLMSHVEFVNFIIMVCTIKKEKSSSIVLGFLNPTSQLGRNSEREGVTLV